MQKDNLYRFRRICLWVIFIIYMAVLFFLVFIAGRRHLDYYRYNLVPFTEIRRYMNELFCRRLIRISLENLFGNVIAFMPFGFFIPALLQKKKKFFNIVTTGAVTCLFSMTIETAQLLCRVGSCDVDDVILNTFGGILGFLVYWWMRKLFIFLIHKKRREREDEQTKQTNERT